LMKFLYTRGAAAVAILPPEIPVGSLFCELDVLA
jgi:hypothetical protein